MRSYRKRVGSENSESKKTKRQCNNRKVRRAGFECLEKRDLLTAVQVGFDFAQGGGAEPPVQMLDLVVQGSQSGSGNGSTSQSGPLTLILDFQRPLENSQTDIFGYVSGDFTVTDFGFAAIEVEDVENAILNQVRDHFFGILNTGDTATNSGSPLPENSELGLEVVVGEIGVPPANGSSEYFYVSIGNGIADPNGAAVNSGILGLAGLGVVRDETGAGPNSGVTNGDVVGSIFTDNINGLSVGNALTSGDLVATTHAIAGTISHEFSHALSLLHINKAGTVTPTGSPPLMGTGAIDLPDIDRIANRDFSISGVNSDNSGATQSHIQQLIGAVGLRDTGPVAQWDFSETSGSTAVDSIGGDNNGVLLSGANFVTDTARGGVLELSNSDSRVTVSPAINLDSTWTIGGWFEGLSSNYWKTLTRGLAGGDHQIIVSNSGWLGSYDNSGGTGLHSSGFDMDTLSGGWHHVAAVGNDGSTTFYVDGTEVGTISFQSTTNVYSIGNHRYGDQNFADRIDDVRVYDRALNSVEVSKLAAPGLSGYLEFEELSGTSAEDSAGGDNDAVLSNGASFSTDATRGRVVGLVGGDAYLKVDALTILEPNWTIGGWYEGLVQPTFSTGIFKTLTHGLAGGDTQIGVNVSGFLGSWDKVGGTGFLSSGFDMDTLGPGWHHVAAVGEDGSTVFFVDGTQVGTIAFQSKSDVSGVGNSALGGTRFADQIDDVRIYNFALDAGEITRLINPGIVGHWRFNELSGSVASDSAGGDNVGSLVAGAAFESDSARGQVLGLLNSNSRVTSGPVVELDSTWTIGGWYEGLASNYWKTLTRGLAGGDHQIIVSNSGWLGSYDNSGGTGFHSSGFDMDTLSGGWHHIAAVGDDGSTTFYVDGTQVGTISFQSTTNVYSIGNHRYGDQNFADRIDDVRVYDRVLSALDIGELLSS